MNASAIALLVVSMLMLWGGLGAAIINLVRHPDLSAGDD
ncbi:methionine/alanine import family NSS transporter small subunit [Dermabacter hominis]|nr:methionine/alanine import family NSS transporter small subunit [Dermabacter hominis]MCT1789390.1 methionine/alanine import family NSS transporter small subunit [Dermabacter hominis]